MLLRYGPSKDGRIEKKAHIYTLAEHGIDTHQVDPDASWVVRQLRREGFQAYIVGGAVRDLLIGRHPKDFDIATDAHPLQIRRVFHSARIIGRRFRIVHVYCGREKYIEVTTFRSRSSVGTSSSRTSHDNNLYGTMEEDAERRDFTMNALYYNPVGRQVIDYVGGYADIKARRIKTLLPAETSFAEDPVRMIRAVKYACLADFPLPPGMANLIRRQKESILSCSRERVTEEVYKILTSGKAEGILELADRMQLFAVIFPALDASFHAARQKVADTPLFARLRSLDERAREGKALARDAMFELLFRDLALERKELREDVDPLSFLQQFLRQCSEPLFPSKRDIGIAAEAVLREAWPHRKPPAASTVQRRHPPVPASARGAAGALTGRHPPTRRRRRRRGRGRGKTPPQP